MKKLKAHFKDRYTSPWVYIIDTSANIGITLGGLMVIFAVIGMLAFIGWQVWPLFRSADTEKIAQHSLFDNSREIAPEDMSPLYLCSDEYRRVGVAIHSSGLVQMISLSTGRAFHSFYPEELKGAKITSVYRSPRPVSQVQIGAVQNIPHYLLGLGTSDGRVLVGSIEFITDFLRYTPDEEPPELAKLKRPDQELFASSTYVPQVFVDQGKFTKHIVEPMNQLGFYRTVEARLNVESTIASKSFEGQAIEKLVLRTSPPEETEREVLALALSDHGKARIIQEKFSFNPFTEELEHEGSNELELSSLLNPVDFVALAGGGKAAVLANEQGQVAVLERKRGNQWEKAYPLFSVFKGDSSEDQKEQTWKKKVLEQRKENDLPALDRPLKLTSVAYALGDASVLFADSLGGIQQWFSVRESEQKSFMKRIRSFVPAHLSIENLIPAEKGKAFLAAEKDGRIRIINMTSERVYFQENTQRNGTPIACYPPKGNGVLALDAEGHLHHWSLQAPHTEISFRTLFQKVWYEGHEKPKYIWQSSSGTDDTEPKLSMTPLIFGTLKGAFYSMIFSIPLAVLAAIYTSEFMSFRLRNIVKPTMEVMASLPSVVLGFLAALYIAPFAAKNLPSLALFFVIVAAVFIVFGWFWQQLPPGFTGRFGTWKIVVTLLLLFLLSVFLSTTFGPRIEALLFPKQEGANPALLDSKSFQPRDKAIEESFNTGDIRSWTHGGATTVRDASVVQKTNKQDGTSITYLDGIKLLQDPELEKSSISGNLVKENEQERVEILTTIPKGWWLPGGHTLFKALLFLFLVPFFIFLFKALFSGIHLGPWSVQVWKNDRLPHVHPANIAQRLLEKTTGQSPTPWRMTFSTTSLSTLYFCCIIALALGSAWVLGSIFEGAFFSYDHPTAGSVPDFRRFLIGEKGWKFEQTNSLVVGFAMGFAVVPIIYTISEDALSTVPNQLRSASLACGATRWQTVLKVILPAALPGIFSAIVIGLGRAIGETMIVVMAAGGTPLMDFQPFNGFRSLAAAIAIEIPEAPHGGTLFRSLFLAGLLLFIMTFIINTFAELVRIRLRKKMARM